MTLLHAAEKTKDALNSELERQVLSLARNIGLKYNYEVPHSVAVENMALQIFDALSPVHGMGHRDRFLLQAAAILHDIGKFVSLRRHYFFSYRLILSSDILGFTEKEKEVIANVAHYHSKGAPTDVDPNFSRLGRAEKVLVAKLAAMIRLADSLDRSHRQKTTSCEIRLRGDDLEFKVSPIDDFSLEKWTFEDKAEFFENVHGVRPVLIHQSGGAYAV